MNPYEIDYAEKFGMYEDEAQDSLNEEFYDTYDEVIQLSDELSNLAHSLNRVDIQEMETWQSTTDFIERYERLRDEVEEILDEVETFLEVVYEENYQI